MPTLQLVSPQAPSVWPLSITCLPLEPHYAVLYVLHSWSSEVCRHIPEVIRCCRIHVEPGSDLLFMENLMFTLCYGGQVKGWERLKPQPVPPEPPALSQSLQDKPHQPSLSQQGAARPAPARLPVSRDHEARRVPEHAAPRQHTAGDPGLQSICTPPAQGHAEKQSL